MAEAAEARRESRTASRRASTAGRAQATPNLPRLAEILVDRDGGKAPCIRLRRCPRGRGYGRRNTLLGLEVLWPEEHALAPRYAVLTGHAQAPVGPLVKHSFSSSESWDIVSRSRVADKWGDGSSQSTAATTSLSIRVAGPPGDRPHRLPPIRVQGAPTSVTNSQSFDPATWVDEAPRSPMSGGASTAGRSQRAPPRIRFALSLAAAVLLLLLAGGTAAYLSRPPGRPCPAAPRRDRSSLPKPRSKRQTAPRRPGRNRAIAAEP